MRDAIAPPEADIECPGAAMRARRFLEANDDGMIEGLAQPVWHALPQDTRGAFPKAAASALSGDDQDKPCSFALGSRQELPQCDKSFLLAHPMEVDCGFGRGTAAGKLLAQPPLKRGERGRGFGFGGRWRPSRIGFPFDFRVLGLNLRLWLRLRRLRQTASGPARDVAGHVKPKLNFFRA